MCFRLGGAASSSWFLRGARLCSTGVMVSQVSSIVLSNRNFASILGLSLESGRPYALAFENCTFDDASVADLEMALMQYDIHELHMPSSQIPPDALDRFLELLCMSQLMQFDLSGITLSRAHVAILEQKLPFASPNRIHIKVESSCDVLPLENVCLRQGISLTVSREQGQVMAAVQQPLLSEVVDIGQIDLTLQGGFNKYTHVVTRVELIRVMALLTTGFHFTLIDGCDKSEVVNSIVCTVANGRGFILPWSRDLSDLSSTTARIAIKYLLESQEIKKSCSSFASASRKLKKYDITLGGVFFDLSLAIKELNPSTSLSQLRRMRRRFQNFDLYSKNSSVSTVPTVEEAELQFAIQVADVDYRIRLQLTRRLKWSGYYSHFINISMPLEKLLCSIEMRGTSVNQGIIEEQIACVSANVTRLQRHIDRASKRRASIFHKRSVSREARDTHLLIIEQKQQQTQLRMLREILQSTDPCLSRVHVRHSQFSSSSRIKTLPSTDLFFFDNNLHKVFLPESGKKLFYFDFTCLSLRVLAQLSQDPLLVSLCLKNKNFRDLTVAINRSLFKKKEFISKTILLARYMIAFMSRENFKAMLLEETEECLERYRRVFPRVSAFHKAVMRGDKKNASEFGLRSAESQRGNTLARLKLRVLGTARDYICLFSVKLQEELRRQDLKTIIHSIRESCVLINLEANEKPTIEAIAQKINSSIVKWVVPVPVLLNDVLDVQSQSEEPILSRDYLDATSMSVFFENMNPAAPPIQPMKNAYYLGHSGYIKNILKVIYKSALLVRSRALLLLNRGTRTLGLMSPAYNPLKSSSRLIPMHEYELAVEAVLQKNFNSLRLKELQKSVILHILRGEDTVAVLPTGYGKSVCFQIPALVLEGITVVVSPLIALIENQLVELAQKQIPAKWIKSADVDIDEKLMHLQQYKILYATPETITSPKVIQALHRNKVSLFAIDEAHCIHQWGKTFRASYREIGCIKTFFPKAAILALSATATPDVIKDIRDVLQIRSNKLVVGSFFKDNLSIHIKKRRNVGAQLSELIDRYRGEAGIVYCRTRSDVDRIYQFLISKGYIVSKYHAQMEQIDKTQVLSQFLSDECKLVVATMAFGLGINKSNVRFVCHVQMPDNIEKFYQEVGRAGRDGLPAESLLLFHENDFVQNRMLHEKIGELSNRSEMVFKTRQMYFFCNHIQCRQLSIARYFGDTVTAEPCHNCDVCLGSAESIDGTHIIQQIIRTIIGCNESRTMEYVVRVLCKIDPYSLFSGHNQLSTFGCLSEYASSSIKGLITYAVCCGYIAVRNCPTSLLQFLACNELSFEILEGKRRVYIQKPALHAAEDAAFPPLSPRDMIQQMNPEVAAASILKSKKRAVTAPSDRVIERKKEAGKRKKGAMSKSSF